jgi:hypothetical protein
MSQQEHERKPNRHGIGNLGRKDQEPITKAPRKQGKKTK